MRKEELYRNFIGYRETEKLRKTEYWSQYLFPNSQFSNILESNNSVLGQNSVFTSILNPSASDSQTSN